MQWALSRIQRLVFLIDITFLKYFLMVSEAIFHWPVWYFGGGQTLRKTYLKAWIHTIHTTLTVHIPLRETLFFPDEEPILEKWIHAQTNKHIDGDGWKWRETTSLKPRKGEEKAADIDKCSLRPDYCSRINSLVPATLSPWNFLQPKLFNAQG